MAKTKGGKVAKKGGSKSDDGEPCSNCGASGATRKCSQCRQTQYCGEECFKVRECANVGARARVGGRRCLSCAMPARLVVSTPPPH